MTCDPRRALCRGAAVLILAAAGTSRLPAAPPLPARHIVLELPGAPAAIIPADLDGDGVQDLVVPLVYSEFEEIEFERAQGFVQFTEIVPALFERREIRTYLAQPDGSYRLTGPPAPMPASVISLEAGRRGAPLIALTDEGVARGHLAPGEQGSSLALEPLLAVAPALRGAGSFLPRLGLLHDLDGQGDVDLLFPARDGIAVYLARAGIFGSSPTATLAMPGDRRERAPTPRRWFPLPRVEDVDGDRLPDLVLGGLRDDGHGVGDDDIRVLRGLGNGRFEAARAVDVRCSPALTGERGELAHFGDLDGDGRAEVVIRKDQETGDDGMEEAKEPRARYAFHRLGAGLAVEPAPYRTLDVVGYGFGGTWPHFSGAEFVDLDGDGRRDLLTMTLDFSMMQVLRVLTTKRFGMEMHFHPWAQLADGSFRQVPGQDLSAKVLVNLNELRLGNLPLFAGDFDGDGAVDFVELTGGRTVRIRRGHAGCAYSDSADWELRLEEEPRHAGLLRVADLDGDDRADLALTRPISGDTQGATSPVVVDLYLSRGAR